MKALVLCGGGALGSYEIGVWKYLREKDLHFDIVTGTSIGALNGAMYVSDEYERSVELWENIAADSVAAHGLNLSSTFLRDYSARRVLTLAKSYIKHQGLDISPFERIIKSAISPRKIKDSKTIFGIVTSSYPRMKEKDILVNELNEDLIIDYLHASSACWPIFPVRKVLGKKYVDGGWSNNLPIDYAIRLGATEIVAVRLHSFPAVPQHPELMSLPFVTLIEPSVDNGNIMDFNHQTIIDNMNLGYLDAKKRFGEDIGFLYSFIDDGEYDSLAETFLRNVLKNDLTFWKKSCDCLNFRSTKPQSSKEYFIRSIEMIGDWLGLNPYVEYSVHSFVDKCLTSLHDLSKNNSKGISKISSNKTERKLQKKERKDFLCYLYTSFSSGNKAHHAAKFFKHSPETAFIKKAMSYLVKTTS